MRSLMLLTCPTLLILMTWPVALVRWAWMSTCARPLVDTGEDEIKEKWTCDVHGIRWTFESGHRQFEVI